MQTDNAIAQKIKARLPSLASKDHTFAQSLLSGFNKWGSFTARQRPYAEALAGTSYAVPLVAMNAAGILTLLQRAKSAGLKSPAFELNADGSILRLSLAPDTGANPGAVYVKKDGHYTGKISPTGTLTYARDIEHSLRIALMPAITRMAADPMATAREFGHLTGRCCFCSRRLDDERSVMVGYGPVCAERYGLAWGVQS